MATGTTKKRTDAEKPEQVDEATAQKDLKKRAPRPTFELQKIGDAFPEENKRGGRGRGKSTEYMEALKQVMELNDGEVYQIATFYTLTGAQTAVRALEKGERSMPEGRWEIQSRTSPERKESVLLVRYLGKQK